MSRSSAGGCVNGSAVSPTALSTCESSTIVEQNAAIRSERIGRTLGWNTPPGCTSTPSKATPVRCARLPALGLAAVQAGGAAVHHHHRGRAAFGAQLRAYGKMRLGEGIGLLGSGLEFRALFLHHLTLMHVKFGLLEQSDGLQVPFDHVSQLCDGRGHELAARLPIAALGVEYGLQLFDQECGVATLAEHR